MKPVQLHDGRIVDSSSEEWRLECEAMTVLAMPTKAARRKYLDRIEVARGPVAGPLARYELGERIKAIRRARGGS